MRSLYANTVPRPTQAARCAKGVAIQVESHASYNAGLRILSRSLGTPWIWVRNDSPAAMMSWPPPQRHKAAEAP
jgi:hypothetical protein